jgi:hypothetical protein
MKLVAWSAGAGARAATGSQGGIRDATCASKLGLVARAEDDMDGTSEVGTQVQHRQWVGGPWPVLAAALAGWAAATSCTSTTFVSTWKAHDALPIKAKGSKVAAVVMMRSDASRRAAEDRLAHEITKRGAVGVPSYMIFSSSDPGGEGQARALMQAQGVAGVVVLRPVGIDKTLEVTPVYNDPMYGGYWGGYYAHGWGNTWGAPGAVNTYVTTTVSVETLIYSLVQNKLLWGGQSKTTDPQDVDQLVIEIASAAADELEHEGMLAP